MMTIKLNRIEMDMVNKEKKMYFCIFGVAHHVIPCAYYEIRSLLRAHIHQIRIFVFIIPLHIHIPHVCVCVVACVQNIPCVPSRIIRSEDTKNKSMQMHRPNGLVTTYKTKKKKNHE